MSYGLCTCPCHKAEPWNQTPHEFCEECLRQDYWTPATRAVGWDGHFVCDFHATFRNRRLPEKTI